MKLSPVIVDIISPNESMGQEVEDTWMAFLIVAAGIVGIIVSPYRLLVTFIYVCLKRHWMLRKNIKTKVETRRSLG